MDQDFRIKAGEFEGPLDLLLDLIERRKLHISDVSLTQVADEFIEYTKGFEDFPIADSADFILIASTLLLIKSKSLLPNLELTQEEEESIENLEERLELYKRYKELSVQIQKMFGNFLYFAEESKQKRIVFAPTIEITTQNLREALLQTINSIPKEVKLDKVTVAKVVSLEEMMDKLSKRIEEGLRTSFREFTRLPSPDGSDIGGQANMGKTQKVDVIISFLAMLELVKRGSLRVSQENHFDDITMETENIGLPNYR